ncbi:MAG: hypothetical protein HQK52_22725 [Oligoflexia bacterium]|nr:hypothetical protein [Oligoflexia bacterium]
MSTNKKRQAGTIRATRREEEKDFHSPFQKPYIYRKRAELVVERAFQGIAHFLLGKYAVTRVGTHLEEPVRFFIALMCSLKTDCTDCLLNAKRSFDGDLIIKHVERAHN